MHCLFGWVVLWLFEIVNVLNQDLFQRAQISDGCPLFMTHYLMVNGFMDNGLKLVQIREDLYYV